ncbi:MAG: addiction module toxin RelE [Firmicutes bacterium]|nr:addiction module toxin RelE [Bacillota bacterium]
MWQIAYTEEAEQDLRTIYEHIALSLCAPETAKINFMSFPHRRG